MTKTPRDDTWRLRAAIYTTMGLMAVMMVVSPIFASGGDYLHDPLFRVFAGGLAALVGTLFLVPRIGTARTAHVFVALLFVLVWGFAFEAHDTGYLIGNFAYATVVILVAAFFLRPWAVLLYAAGNLVGVVVIQETFGLERADQVTSYLYIVMFSSLLYAIAYQKDQEHLRQEEAVRHAERLTAEAAFRDYQTALLNRAAHRLQTPLMPLTLRLDALDARREGRDPKDQEILDDARGNVARLSDAIKEFLQAARIVQGPGVVERAHKPVRPILEAAAERFQGQRPGRIRVTVDAPTQLDCWVHEEDLRRLVLALLDNAADASAQDAEVVVRAVPERDGVRVEVEDQGVGIPADQKAALDRFLTFEDRASEDAGLGFLLARAIARRHDTRVECHSDGPDAGARFSTWFPPEGRTAE